MPTLCLAAVGPLNTLTGQSTGPEAAYQPFVSGVNIYVSKMGNMPTLKQYARTVGTQPVKLGRRSEAGNKIQEGDEIAPPGSLYVYTRND